MFQSNGEVDKHLSPLVMLRNELAHPKEMFVSEKVRASGEPAVRWFGEKLGVGVELVPAVSPHP